MKNIKNPVKFCLKKMVLAQLLLLATSSSFALTFALPVNGDNVVGNVQHAVVEPGDNFHTIARRFDVGYYELVEANPELSPETPKTWSDVIIPTRFVLPPGPHQGIVISQAELRLYYYPPHEQVVVTFPIGIGREGWRTPLGAAKVVTKTKDPIWTVPESIKKDAIAQGQTPLPNRVMPGPENPLGKFAMRLSLPTYLIHGTNRPDAIGTRSTAGCIRLFPEDIERLFEQVKIGTPVRIIDDAYKAGWYNGQLYLEAHLPLQEQQAEYNGAHTPMLRIVTDAVKQHNGNIDWDRAQEVIKEQSGIPEIIGNLKNQSANINQDGQEAKAEANPVELAKNDYATEVKPIETTPTDQSIPVDDASISNEDEKNLISQLSQAETSASD